MKKTGLSIVKIMTVVIILSPAFSGPLSAQRHGRGQNGDRWQKNMNDTMKGQGAGFMHEIPDLTKEQKEKIGKSKLDMDAALIPLRNQKKEKEAHLRTLNAEDNVDQAAIDKTIDEISGLEARLAKIHNKHLQEVRSLLTKEQKVFFDSRPHPGPNQGNGPMTGRHMKKRMERRVMPCPAGQMK